LFSGTGDHYICEGPVTGLSLWQVTGGTVHVTCGADNMKNFVPPKCGVDSVCVVADTDETGLSAAVTLCEVLLRRDGLAVKLCRLDDAIESPHELAVVQSVKGFDFNDAHSLLGADFALKQLDKARIWQDMRASYWDEPDFAQAPPASPLPLDGLPVAVADFVREQAHAIQVHPDRILGSLLCVLGTLACGRFSLNMRSASNSFAVAPNMFVFQVGRPSAKKSPSMGLARDFLGPAVAAEGRRRTEALAKVGARKKSIKTQSDSLLSKIKSSKDGAAIIALERELEKLEVELTTLDREPVPYDPLYTTDATPEAIIGLASGSSRGILLYFDEASKLIKQLAREGFAEIRPLLNSGFSGSEPYRCDRVTVHRPHIDALRLGLLCGIQPDVLQPLLTGEDDGFLARVLFINPSESKGQFVDEPQNATLRQTVQSIVGSIYETEAFRVISFSPEAMGLYVSVFGEHEDLKEGAIGQSRHLEGFLGKHESMFGKICLTLHVMNMPVTEEVPAHTVAAAHELFKAMFTHYQKTMHQGFINHPLVDAIVTGRLSNIKTVRDLKRSSVKFESERQLQSLLKDLEEKKVLRVIETKGANRPSQVIVFNPHLEGFRKQCALNRPGSETAPAEGPVATPSGAFAPPDAYGTFGTFGTRVVIPSGDECLDDLVASGIRVREWTPEDGKIGSCVAIDTETSPIVGNETPELRLLQACGDPDLVFMVSPTNAIAFLNQHHDAKLVFHNFSFDCAVILKATGIDLSRDLAEEKCRIVDTALLYRLVGLAVEGEVPNKWNLALMAQELLGVDLPKDADVRLSWDSLVGRSDELLNALRPEQLEYAALDASVTLRCYEVLKAKLDSLRCSNDLSHQTQLQGAWALRQIESRGIAVDQTLLQRRLVAAASEETAETQALEALGYVPNQKGNRSVLEAEVRKVCEQNSIHLKMTEKSDKPRINDAGLEVLAPKSSLIDRYLKFTRTRKFSDFLKKLDSERVYPRYNTLLRTGRTSCSSPNIQNLPRNGIREVLVPAPGHCFIIADYAAIELVTLAQQCLSRYGHSKMAELINEGRDLHTELARHILKTDDVTTEDRRKAKALNFGIPGGLGAEKLCEYAASTFGVEMSLAEAKKFKSAYLKLFPEVAEHLKSGDGQDEVVSTLSGRIAAKSTYCQARNFVFQGLASDGAKRALFNLERAGLRTVAFIHDEVIVEVPYGGNDDVSLESQGRQIETIMIDSMRHFTPDVAVKVEWFASDRWSKDGELTRDFHGNVIPFSVEVANG
jgi:DNA polymerase-1